MTDDPWDHNAECRYCDEQAAHRADCPWLLALEARVEELEKDKAALELLVKELLHAAKQAPQ